MTGAHQFLQISSYGLSLLKFNLPILDLADLEGPPWTIPWTLLQISVKISLVPRKFCDHSSQASGLPLSYLSVMLTEHLYLIGLSDTVPGLKHTARPSYK
jgi:hypothetical protein